MAYKKLNQFTFFDYQKFSTGKTLKLIGIEPWKDFDTQKILGTKYNTVIDEDHTHYDLKDGEQISNQYEKLVFKVAKPARNIPIGSVVKPVNPVVTVYGDRRNLLAAKADDIQVINPQANQPGGVK